MTTTNHRRVIWFAPLNLRCFAPEFENRLEVGASSRKVSSLCRTMGVGSEKAVLVARPVGGILKKKHFHLARCFRERGYTVVRAPVTGFRVLNILIASLWYVLFSIRFIRSSDRVVFYNFFPEFAFAAIYLALIGNRAVLELEDYPLKKANVRECIGNISFFVMRSLCKKEALVASNSIARLAHLDDYYLLYSGGIELENKGAFGGGVRDELRILYGGTLQKDTGTDVFCEAVEILRGKKESVGIIFYVTGFGDVSKIKKLVLDNDNSTIKVNVCENLGPDEYRSILSTCKVGLSLKNPDGAYGATTFPSKVIEIAENGLLLISTEFEDVRGIFGASAFYLDDYRGGSLADLIEWIARNQDKARLMAQQGKDIVVDRFSCQNMYQQLKISLWKDSGYV